jgi:hypothetical protein
MEKSLICDYLTNHKDSSYCGHIGHKITEACPEGLIPTYEELNDLAELIMSYQPLKYFITMEDPDDPSHAHFLIISPKVKLNEATFRIKYYKKHDRFKRQSHGGATPFTITKSNKIEKKYKNELLTRDEQKLYKITYQIKHYRTEPETRSNECKVVEIGDPSLQVGASGCDYYWRINAKIMTEIKKQENEKKKCLKIIKQRIQIFFDKKWAYTNESSFQSPDLCQVVETLAEFYSTEGVDLPHTAETVERYAMMLVAQYNPDEHKKYLVRKICGKYMKLIS